MRLILTFSFAYLLVQVANGHFTLEGSREQQLFPNSNERFWPVSADVPGGSQRKEPDCMKYPRGNVKNVMAGVSMTLSFEIGNKASHIGMCTMQLLDAQTSNLIADLGSQNNCVSDGQSVTVALPETPCPECVIKVEVTAAHRGPGFYEYYNSCLDISTTAAGSLSTQSLENQSAPLARSRIVLQTPVLDVQNAVTTQNQTDVTGESNSGVNNFINNLSQETIIPPITNQPSNSQYSGASNNYSSRSSTRRRSRQSRNFNSFSSVASTEATSNTPIQPAVDSSSILGECTDINLGEYNCFGGAVFYRCTSTSWQIFNSPPGTICVLTADKSITFKQI